MHTRRYHSDIHVCHMSKLISRLRHRARTCARGTSPARGIRGTEVLHLLLPSLARQSPARRPMSRRTEQRDDLTDLRRAAAEQWRATRGDESPSPRGTRVTPQRATSPGFIAKTWRWLRRRPWIVGLGGAAIAAAFLVPDARSFSRYVRTRQAGPKGLLTGGLAWLQHRTGVRSSFKNCVVCSVATLGSRTFLGAFKTWIELPELPRSFPTRLGEILPADAEGDIDAILGANIVTFLLLQALPGRTVDRHFYASEENVGSRPYTLLSAVFSHVGPMHLISNMHSLVTIAPLVQAALGRRRFIILYLGGGAAASLTSILFNRVMGRRKTGTLGASGAIFALLAANAMMFPELRYSWWGGAELTSGQMLAAMIALDAASGAMSERGIDVAAHAGGAAFGAAFCQWLISQKRGMGILRGDRFG